MTRRIIIGKRGTSHGIWISVPGVDANTATGTDLQFVVTQDTEQLIKIGQVSSLPQTVALGFANPPFVMLNTTNFEIGGGASVNETIFRKPWPVYNSALNTQATVSTGSMVIAGGSTLVNYMCYRRRIA